MKPTDHPLFVRRRGGASCFGPLLAGLLAVFTLAGCATAPDGTAGAPQAEWHDPEFYNPWHDPRAIVLPPPPFTGFSPAGKTEPMLPNRQRPGVATRGEGDRLSPAE